MIDSAIFTDVEKCSSESMEMNTTTKRSCCKDVVDIIQGQDELNFEFLDELDLNPQTYLAIIPDYFDLFSGFPDHVIPFKDYNPPKIIKDFRRITSCYLIWCLDFLIGFIGIYLECDQ